MISRKNRCPVCYAPAMPDHEPFCSGRCADIDMGRWLGGQYRIPGERASEEEMERAAQDAAPDPASGPASGPDKSRDSDDK